MRSNQKIMMYQNTYKNAKGQTDAIVWEKKRRNPNFPNHKKLTKK